MTKLYLKSEIWFSVIWISIYVVGASLMDMLSDMIGVPKSLTFVFLAILSAVICVWLAKNKLWEKYGLCKTDVHPKNFLFFIPLLAIVSVNFWFGVSVSGSMLEGFMFILAMICVGFVEEIIFRGFLFKALAKENLKVAIIVASLTFGVGHIINLISSGGENLVANICQVIYATAVGFLFIVIFYRGKTLIPCIVAHSFVNATSFFMSDLAKGMMQEIISCVVIVVIAVGYALVLMKTLPKVESANNKLVD